MPEMSEQQLRAVNFRDGVLLLLAGPGSGKTFVLTHRVRQLVNSGIDSSHILVITFTKAAALQMKERFLRIVSPKTPEVTFGTFHAVFYNILKSQPAYRRVSAITEKEKLNILKRTLEIAPYKDADRDGEDNIHLLSLISACKNNGNNVYEFEQEMLDKDEFINIFNEYNRQMKMCDKIDFDDMINICLLSLKENPDVLARWQSRFRYILIDEFQDISGNQYELVKLLAYPQNNIFAVGDDDQSIYSFRGAKVELMHRLLEEYSDAKKEYLSVNYRCSKAIVDKAGYVIEDNKNRFEKKITSGRDAGEEVHICSVANGTKQDEEILSIINNSRTKKDDIAILTRTNRMGKKYSDLLRINGIECKCLDLSVPFSSKFINDIMAFLALAAGENTRKNYLKIINKPSRFVSRESMPFETVNRNDLINYYARDTNMIRRLRNFFDGLDRIKLMSISLAIRYIRNVMEYDKYLKGSLNFDEYNDYCSEISLFMDFAKDCQDYRTLADKLSLFRESKKVNSEESEGVNIMTYHGSKGLEFETVILPDVNENVCPSKSAHGACAIEEERRMFYVAMTRAKDELHIIYRTDEGRKPSRFLKV